jgi:hypothetical protein
MSKTDREAFCQDLVDEVVDDIDLEITQILHTTGMGSGPSRKRQRVAIISEEPLFEMEAVGWEDDPLDLSEPKPVLADLLSALKRDLS